MLLAHLEATADPNFWATTVPNWIGALGGLISAFIGGIALITSLRARTGVKTLARGANTETLEAQTSGLLAEVRLTADASATPAERSAWTIRPDGKDRYSADNISQVTAELLAITQLEGGDDIVQMTELPKPVGPRTGIPFIVAKTFSTPLVMPVRITWRDPDQSEHDATFYL